MSGKVAALKKKKSFFSTNKWKAKNKGTYTIFVLKDEFKFICQGKPRISQRGWNTLTMIPSALSSDTYPGK